MTATVCTMSASDFSTSEPLRLSLPSMDARSLSEEFKSRHDMQHRRQCRMPSWQDSSTR